MIGGNNKLRKVDYHNTLDYAEEVDMLTWEVENLGYKVKRYRGYIGSLIKI